MKIQRYIQDQVLKDLQKKMVLISGPRQVGKTTLAKSILEHEDSYLNWDIPTHREKILMRQVPRTYLWCFDELYKHKKWKNFLKGLYDEFHEDHSILVTGSARLDLFKKAGDSLQGRYYHLRLHPLSVAELKIETQEDFLDLLELGGFPEPFFSSSQVEARRWSTEYKAKVLYEEIREFDVVSDITKLELLSLRLPELVGSPLSLNSLREDLQIAHKTVSRWIELLEKMYMIFRLPPFGHSLLRAVKKEQKHYHFDWILISDQGLKFENLMACHLLKWCHYRRDVFGERVELSYFRDTDSREIDFCLLKDGKPTHFIECKWNQTSTSKHLKYLKQKFPQVDALQVCAIGKDEYMTKEKIHHVSALSFLKNLV